MNMLFEGLKEKGSMVIVPSSALDSMNLGAMGGLISLAKANEPVQLPEKEQTKSNEPEKSAQPDQAT
jgi:hypothetical protein